MIQGQFKIQVALLLHGNTAFVLETDMTSNGFPEYISEILTKNNNVSVVDKASF